MRNTKKSKSIFVWFSIVVLIFSISYYIYQEAELKRAIAKSVEFGLIRTE